jgi:hypothetical protein
MLLRKFEQNPVKMMRVGRIVLAIGLLIGAAGAFWLRLPVHLRFSPDADDFIRGATLGLGIGLEIGSIFLMLKAKAARLNLRAS